MFINDNKKDNILSRLGKIDKDDFATIKYFYEKKLKHKDLMISQLNNTLKDEKLKYLNYVEKHKEIDTQYIKFLDGKDKLTDMLKYLQENLLLSQETIENLENDNNLKDISILNLKQDLSEQEDRILSLVQEIDNLQREVNELNHELELNNEKSSASFFQRMFK